MNSFSSACTPVPYRDTTTPITLLSWGTPQTVSPSLCPDLGAVPPSVGGFGRIPPPQHLGTSRSLGPSDLGRPFPTGQAGKGHTPLCPCPACLARTARRALVSHSVPPQCTCCLPRSGSAPPAPCPAQRGPQGDSGEQSATLPCPGPAGYGTHTLRTTPASGSGLVSPEVRDSLQKQGVSLAVKQPTRREEPLFALNLAPHRHPTSPPVPFGV